MSRTTLPAFLRVAYCARVGVAALATFLTIDTLQAAPWMPLPGINPGPSNLIPDPRFVPGKDFSDYRDRDFMGMGDPEQVLAWDGLGGVRDSFDYNSPSILHPPGIRPLLSQPQDVDGLAAGGDALFHALRDNLSGLIFSVGGIGYGLPGDSVLHYVKPTGMPSWLPGTGVWATPPMIDGMNPIPDLDGLELWGGNNADDSDRYSVYGDPFVPVPGAALKVAIWAFDSATGVSDPHTFTTDLAAAIDMQYGGPGVGGPIWSHLVELMDLDAMMTFGSEVIFSIAPISLSPLGPGLPDFDGGEIFVYKGAAMPTSFLFHGGLTWDTVLDVRGTFGVPIENIDAIEAVSQFVPEPASVILALVAFVGLAIVARRKS